MEEMSKEVDKNDVAAPQQATETKDEEPPGAEESKSDIAATVDDILKSQEDPEEEEGGETVSFKVIFCKTKHEVEFGLDKTIIKLKNHLQKIIGVPPAMQKIMIKGLAQDDQTLRSLGVTKGAKVMVVGSKLDDVIAVSAPSPQELAAAESSTKEKETFCSQTMHKKILDKGIPDDALPGIKGIKEPLPAFPLHGMLNKQGKKVRLTFKMELDELWIGTQQRTDKIPMSSIKAVVNEVITGHEEYHILAIQLGPTEASRYWIYWIPAQYVDAIKDSILGKWQYF
ncbi:ubiquitin domain-containing protein UBFD1-like [Neocloeon triangulifer]|uniref:ubiquitin domain-containing protein UBFD1-like n=1 Tax=Neocloeon triangulifer TaxID=2078957 RepID=UPI00286FA52C|nr:ubiquitin domain-containing protein UBFD1-like [Neocloeon triangulifer]